MPDDRTKRDLRDRQRVSAEEDYEVRELIRKHGNSRDVLEQAAKALRDRPASSDEVTRDARQQRSAMHLGNPKSRNG